MSRSHVTSHTKGPACIYTCIYICPAYIVVLMHVCVYIYMYILKLQSYVLHKSATNLLLTAVLANAIFAHAH